MTASDTSSQRPRQRLPKAARILGYVLFIILVVEVSLRAILWYTIEDLDSPYGCGGPVAMSRMNFLYHRLKGQDLFSVGLIAHDANRGYKLASDLQEFPLDEQRGISLSTNSEGFRGAAEYAPSPLPGIRRIVAIGDSFTFGENVRDEDTWPAQLATTLGDTEVLNLGVFAYSHDQATLALRDDGLRYDPDVVILGYQDSNLRRSITPFFCFAKPVPTPSGPDPFEGIPVPSPEDIKMEFWTRSFMVRTIQMALQVRSFEENPDPTISETAGTFLLDMMRALAEESGARFIVLYMPGREELQAHEREFIARYVAASGVEFLDPRPVFKEVLERDGADAYDALYLPEDHHPSAAGYRLIAEEVKLYLEAHPTPPSS